MIKIHVRLYRRNKVGITLDSKFMDYDPNLTLDDLEIASNKFFEAFIKDNPELKQAHISPGFTVTR